MFKHNLEFVMAEAPLIPLQNNKVGGSDTEDPNALRLNQRLCYVITPYTYMFVLKYKITEYSFIYVFVSDGSTWKPSIVLKE